MVSFPPCKINLGLSVVRKRRDGYHDIETCFYPIPLTDILEVIPSDRQQITFSGKEIPGDSGDNLCLKAYQLLQRDFAIGPVKIHLHKIIPTGAGLGGGSSDAAYMLRLLNDIFELALDQKSMMSYAALLGSDCSFFIQDRPMLGTGRGEVLEPGSVDLKGKFLILLNPGLHISTAEAYAGVMPSSPALPIINVLERPIREWQKLLQNDFERSVFPKFSLVADLKSELYSHGAVYASMSGSGSSVYGIFEHEVSSESLLCKPYVIWSGYL